MWKLWLISGFCGTFDVPCLRTLVTERVRKNVFNQALGIARTVERTRNDALHWIGELQEIDPTSFSRVKIKARYTRKGDDVFDSTTLAILNATMRHGFDFRLLPLDILVTWECEIENNIPHLSTRHIKENKTLSYLWLRWEPTLHISRKWRFHPTFFQALPLVHLQRCLPWCRGPREWHSCLL